MFQVLDVYAIRSSRVVVFRFFYCFYCLCGSDQYWGGDKFFRGFVYYSIARMSFVLDDICKLFVEVCCFLFIADACFVVVVSD